MTTWNSKCGSCDPGGGFPAPAQPTDVLTPWPYSNYELGETNTLPGLYRLCWGPNAVDCETSTFSAGTLQVDPYIESFDFECQRRSNCTVTVRGDGFQVNDTLALVYVTRKRGKRCPGEQYFSRLATRSDDTTVKVFDFGPLETAGTYAMCLCTQWYNEWSMVDKNAGAGFMSGCTEQSQFRYELGELENAGVDGGQYMFCEKGSNCTAAITGVGLHAYDEVVEGTSMREDTRSSAT